jgi:osmotically-inducible protein OsmY
MADNDKTVEQDPDYAMPGGDNRSDDQISNDVLNALAGTERIDVAKITIQVENSTVHLSGQVLEDGDRDMAESITRNVPGVHQVVNELIVMAPTPLSEFPSHTSNRPAVQ